MIPSSWKWSFRCMIGAPRSSLDLSNTGNNGSSAGVSSAWRIRAFQKKLFLQHRRTSVTGGTKLRTHASLLESKTSGAIFANTSWRNSARLNLFTLISGKKMPAEKGLVPDWFHIECSHWARLVTQARKICCFPAKNNKSHGEKAWILKQKRGKIQMKCDWEILVPFVCLLHQLSADS